MKKICDMIIERNLDIEWFLPNRVRADTFDEELINKMAKAGCKRVYMSPEPRVHS